MISNDNKLARTKKTGYKRITKSKKKEQPKKDPDLFSYDEYPQDDFFFGKDIPRKQKEVEYNIKINK